MRRLFAVMVLAAVITMHGTPALAVDSSPPRDAAGMTISSQSDPLTEAADGRSGVLDEPGRHPTGSPLPEHDAESHLWAACLAVLLAGITLLAAAARLRGTGIPLLRNPTVRASRSSGWTVPPRPPDLHVLCLLRT